MTSASADYAPSTAPGDGGGEVALVQAESPAERGGIVAGDRIVSADGVELLDVIDWHWFADEESVELEVVDRGGIARTVVLERDTGQPWGIEFTEALFDSVHVCKNACTFCFMSMLPKGMRSALYLRDDDYRLSFLQGNFVTLTNVTDEDLARIVEQHIAPLHVSVHAWDDEVRRTLIGRNALRGKEVLEHLFSAHIPIHAQIVLIPGVNDGAVLDETLRELLAHEAVLSIGVVPLGFTSHQSRYTRSFDAARDALAVIEQVELLRRAWRERIGESRVHLADEFYLAAAVELPAAELYDGFPQFEDGIGMVRSFIDDAKADRDRFAQTLERLETSDAQLLFVTGTQFAPVLASIVGRNRVVAVENRYFGGNVGVSGLIVGEDLLSTLRTIFSGGELGTPEAMPVVFIPSVMFNADGLTLDGFTAEQLRGESGGDLRVIECTYDGVAKAVSSVLS